MSNGIKELYTEKQASFGIAQRTAMRLFMMNPEKPIREAFDKLSEINLSNDILKLRDLIVALTALDYEKSSGIIPLLTGVDIDGNISDNLTGLKPLWPLLIFADYYAKSGRVEKIKKI